MSPRPARKLAHSYHHGDLRDALIKAALREAEHGGPEAISMSALAKKLGVSQPAPYKHFADREELLSAVAVEAFRLFNAALAASIRKPSKRSKLLRFAEATLDFGLNRNGIYRMMFGTRSLSTAPEGSELRSVATECLGIVMEALDAPEVGLLRERHALAVWASLHGVVMLAHQGMFTGHAAQITREELLEHMMEQTRLSLSVAIEAARTQSP